tara:strand:- start:487 stop:762 length:276 start_codon:yes stop_codon:yes gene_type:complete
MIIKLPFKKNPKFTDYNFTLKNPIDFRYLSFNHFTTMKIMFKIKYGIVKKIQKTLRHKLLIVKKSYWNFLSFCECKEIKKQDKIRLSFALE